MPQMVAGNPLAANAVAGVKNGATRTPYDPYTAQPVGGQLNPPPSLGMPAAASTNPAQLGGTVAQNGVGGFNTGTSITGPNAAAFNAQAAAAQGLANQYGAGANAALNRSAPQIQALGAYNQNVGADAKQFGQEANQFGQLAQNDQLAQNEYQQALGQSLNSNTALARSATGGAIGQAGAERAALEGNAQTTAGAAGQAGLNQGQLQLGALQAQQGAYGAQQGAYGAQLAGNQAQANLQAGQNTANYTYAGNLQGLQNNSSQAGLAADTAYTSAFNQSQGLSLNSAIANANANLGQENVAASVFSDADAKLVESRKAQGDGDGYSPELADDFLRSIHPRHFAYKDPSLAPSPDHGGGFLGVFAQDVEQAPGIGDQIVTRAPNGLRQINQGAGLSAALAGIGRLHERLAALEDDVGKKKALTSDETVKDPLPDEGASDETDTPAEAPDVAPEEQSQQPGAQPFAPAAGWGGGGPTALPSFGQRVATTLSGSRNPVLQAAATSAVPSTVQANTPTANSASATQQGANAALSGTEPGGKVAAQPMQGQGGHGILAGLISAAEVAGVAAVMAAA
jgi:hypothetical protein